MFKRPKTGGRDFQVGNPGGPGRPPLDKDLNKAKRLNHAFVFENLNRFVNMPLDDLQIFIKDRRNTALEMMIASIVMKAITTGDQSKLNFLLDRSVGKVKEVHEVTHLGNLNAAIVDKIAQIEKANQKGGTDGQEKSTEDEKSKEEVT